MTHDLSDLAEREADLAARIDLTACMDRPPVTIAGVDVSYEKGSDHLVAAAVLLDVATLDVIESSLVAGEATFPYVPGMLGFRETPVVLEALAGLTGSPDVIVCDGYGIAHPRRLGMACHVGALTGKPTFGVAKTPFVVTAEEPGDQRGRWSALTVDGEVLGRAVRTVPGVKPVFVSVGNRITLDQATDLTVRVSRRYRIPEPIRRADFLSREALRERRVA